MENCKHLFKIQKWNHSILNPQKWMCYICGTTESVWACLSCPNVACGRFNEEHALKHFKESQHPLCIEVNEKYVYCYECDDYVLNDNVSGDLKILRSALGAIATQSFKGVEPKGRRLLRSYSHTAVVSPSKTDEDDKNVTADFHRKQVLLRKVFAAWHSITTSSRPLKVQTPEKQGTQSGPDASPLLKRRTLIPGMTGLRNLGNTCYLNSILQVLSHLEEFRDFFRKQIEPNPSRMTSPETSPVSIGSTNVSRVQTATIPQKLSFSPKSAHTSKFLTRQTTTECFEHLMKPKAKDSALQKDQIGGLNGGSERDVPIRRKLISTIEDKNISKTKISLCQELNGLFRVLWSGRWAQVSPYAFLQAVWQCIPAFKGHSQHDAQEFLCELLDKVQGELGDLDSFDIVTDHFQGQLVSQVKCLNCKNLSETTEPFTDLSLEFPERYQFTQQNARIAQDMCHITEMLHKFTEEEKLEGNIYSCENCNASRKTKSPARIIYTQAQKQFLVKKLPYVLRLHLKRFRWSGRNHREKISTQVAFDDVLDMKPFCDSSTDDKQGFAYNLQGVVIHHGRGFGSGHYTAYCWNSEANSWINCNDSKVKLCSLEDVLLSQSYILIYTRSPVRQLSPMNSIHDSEVQNTSGVSQCDSDSDTSTNTDILENSFSQKVDDDITFNFKSPSVEWGSGVNNQRKRKSSSFSSDNRIIKRRRSTLW